MNDLRRFSFNERRLTLESTIYFVTVLSLGLEGLLSGAMIIASLVQLNLVLRAEPDIRRYYPFVIQRILISSVTLLGTLLLFWMLQKQVVAPWIILGTTWILSVTDNYVRRLHSRSDPSVK